MNFLRKILKIKSPSEELLDPMDKERERQIKEFIRKGEGMNNKIKFSHILSVASWISVFLLAWMIIAGRVETNPVSWFFFAFFVIVGFISGVVSVEKKDHQHE